MSAVLESPVEASTSTAIAEFNAETAALAGLALRLKDIAYPALNTGAGMQAAIDDRATLRGMRVDLGRRVETLNKADRAATKQRCEEREATGTRLTASIKALEGPIDEQIKAEEARKEKLRLEREAAEEARKQKHRDAITKIRSYPLVARSNKFTVEQIDAGITFVDAIDTNLFADFAAEAALAIEQAISDLRKQRDDVIGEAARQAREKAQAEEAERVRVENARLLAESERLARQNDELLARLAAAEAAAAPPPVAAAQVPASASPGVSAEGEVSPSPGEPLSTQAPSATPAAAAFTLPPINTTEVNRRLGFNLTVVFIRDTLGIPPFGVDKNATTWREVDFVDICVALVRHITRVTPRGPA